MGINPPDACRSAYEWPSLASNYHRSLGFSLRVTIINGTGVARSAVLTTSLTPGHELQWNMLISSGRAGLPRRAVDRGNPHGFAAALHYLVGSSGALLRLSASQSAHRATPASGNRRPAH